MASITIEITDDMAQKLDRLNELDRAAAWAPPQQSIRESMEYVTICEGLAMSALARLRAAHNTAGGH